MASLRELHLRGGATLLALSSPCVARTVGSLTQLRSLSLQDCLSSLDGEETEWQQLVAPLTGLTCLKDQHNMAATDVGPQELTAVQELECFEYVRRFYASPEDVWYACMAQRSHFTSLKVHAQPEHICGSVGPISISAMIIVSSTHGSSSGGSRHRCTSLHVAQVACMQQGL
jgi:hypothetical protein